MARKIKFKTIGDYASNQMNKLLRASVVETDRQLKKRSPVKTGRFKASWQVGENAAPGMGQPPGEYGSQARAVERIGYSKERYGNVYSVHNNLPYAEPLANGSSPQANAGWVQGVAKDVQTWVRSAADKIGKES